MSLPVLDERNAFSTTRTYAMTRSCARARLRIDVRLRQRKAGRAVFWHGQSRIEKKVRHRRRIGIHCVAREVTHAGFAQHVLVDKEAARRCGSRLREYRSRGVRDDLGLACALDELI